MFLRYVKCDHVFSLAFYLYYHHTTNMTQFHMTPTNITYTNIASFHRLNNFFYYLLPHHKIISTLNACSSGSSVCTSLVEGESMAHPKGMGLLEINLKKFRLKSIPFTQIRPFIYGDISLHDVKGMSKNVIRLLALSVLIGEYISA